MMSPSRADQLQVERDLVMRLLSAGQTQAAKTVLEEVTGTSLLELSISNLELLVKARSEGAIKKVRRFFVVKGKTTVNRRGMWEDVADIEWRARFDVGGLQ